ncbi:hypothetical protein OAF63_01255 [Saprospiraceae bacterium]|jgi:hypothetical protein|nr:hypothetical protein [Bacteroidota bacterium]MDB4727390.1 hypothetical protein [Saprospiraceae bacterium]MDF1865079.1 hypothetical protein [Saprospiraceae bacterium]
MVFSVRNTYNNHFDDKKYQDFQKDICSVHNHIPSFRIAETPIFIGNELKGKLLNACEEIYETICQPDFKELSQGAVLPQNEVPNEDDHTLFLQMDFGICKDEQGDLVPQLIEVQGFPSLYFFQDLLANSYKKRFNIPDNYSHLFHGLSSEDYIDLLRKNIVGDSNPENVILLEVEPEKQVTKIDFLEASRVLGIPIKCVSDLKKEGREVYYFNEKGQKIKVEKIFNRVIFDELANYSKLEREFFFTEEANVEWIGHPNWFFRISKHTLPLLQSQYVPDTQFLNEVKEIPNDLENYVLKPLYSFAGTGVIVNLNRYDIESISDPENYILQRKVEYARVIDTPSEAAKCEVRMLMIWEKGTPRPKIINNLARITKGEMVGVKYNKNKDWVGASVAFFEN